MLHGVSMSIDAATLLQAAQEAAPTILALVLIEGLLSVDNALAIAAMASHLPEKQQKLALRLGIFGAYFFRGVALLAASWIISNEWIKWIGAAYLVYLMAAHFAAKGEADKDEDGDGVPDRLQVGFLATVMKIEFMDLSLSVDNVIAAVALSDKLWVVCTGVFIGILALRFLAGVCIGLLKKFPVLEHTAFLLVGFVGFLLIGEMLGHFHVSAFQKFVGVMSVVFLTIMYERIGLVSSLLKPVVVGGMGFCRLVNGVVMAPFRLFKK